MPGLKDTRHPQIKGYETAKGSRYLVRYRKPNGQQTMKRGFTTVRDALAWLTETETAKATGVFQTQREQKITVDTAATHYLETIRATRKPRTYIGYKQNYENQIKPVWGNVKAGNITTKDLQSWVNDLTLKLTSASVKSAVTTFRAITSTMPVAPNLWKNVQLPKPESTIPHRFLTHAEVEQLAQATPRPEVFFTLAYTGIRVGELCALRWNDVDLDRNRFTIRHTARPAQGVNTLSSPKNGKARQVVFPAFIGEMISGLPRSSEWVFATDSGGFLYQKYIYGWLLAACEATGIERLRIHDLRHTAASLAVQAGANVKLVQQMLGHASAAMTLDVYADLFDTDLDSVAERLELARAHILNTKSKEFE